MLRWHCAIVLSAPSPPPSFGCYDAFATGRHYRVKHALCKRDTTGGRGRGDDRSWGKFVA